MRVSAVIAVHNGADRLPEAIASIQIQDYPPCEILVVDDGSTDATSDVLASFGTAIRVIRQEHVGLSAACNLALRHIIGDAVAFLDHDDLWPPGRLGAMARRLQANPDIDIVGGLVETRYERTVPPSEELLRRIATAYQPWSVQSLLIRRGVFDRVGELDERLTHGMDVDWYMRAREHGIRYDFLPEVALIYRLHDANMTKDVAATTGGILGAFKNSLDRRRQAR